MASPYAGVPVEGWGDVTAKLVAEHPLTTQMIFDAAMVSWDRLWTTTVGDAEHGFQLAELDPPATVVGYFFEKLFAKQLSIELLKVWVGGKGSQKDLHCITDESKSVEMKSSGQLGYKIYGNRSYGQELENEEAGKKDKSGYYITINFYGRTLTLLRFGWIDGTDWVPQKSPTGQMAGLGDDVYRHKLVSIRGPYMLSAPIQLLDGAGKKAASDLAELGIATIAHLIASNEADLPKRYRGLRAAARERFAGLF